MGTLLVNGLSRMLRQGNSYKLNVCKFHLETSGHSRSDHHAGDVGGQKTLRSYWRNYFEKTDALIWVVDATDRLRTEDCKTELAGLLLEEARSSTPLRRCRVRY